MITTFLIGLLASSALSAQTPTLSDTGSYSFGGVLENSYIEHLVQDGEYIALLAKRYYGSEDYWTNIWNDNPQVTDVSHVEAGSVLKVRKNKTVLPETLSSGLSARLSTVYQYTGDNTVEVSVETIVAPVQQVQSQQPAPASTGTGNAPTVLNEEQITYLGQCEAGMDPAKNTGNGYYGAFQFSYGTWKSMGTGYERADMAPLEVQKEAVQRLVARSSIFTQFPGCAKKMRSIGLI
jgi:hypothetical protein